MASRSIVVKIKVEGAKQATASVKGLTDAEAKLRRETQFTNTEQRKQEKHMAALAISAKKLTQVQNGLTKSFIKGNLASRGITAVVMNLQRALRFGATQAIDFEFAMSKISAIAKVSGAEFDNLSNSIRDIASVTPRTASEVANAALQMSKLGLTGTDVERSLKGVIDLSVALDENVGSVGETLVQVKNVFGLSADDIGDAGDKIFTAISSSALSFDKLKVAMGFVGGSAAIAGVSLEELSALMGTLADSGLRASTIGTSLRTMLTRLATPSSKASKELGGVSLKTHSLSQVLEALGKNINGPDEAFKLFGKTAQTAAIILSKNSDRVADLTEKTEAMTNKTSEASAIMNDTMHGALKKVASAWADFNIELSEFAGPLLVGSLELVSGAINGITTAIQDLKEASPEKARQGLERLGALGALPNALTGENDAKILAERKALEKVKKDLKSKPSLPTKPDTPVIPKKDEVINPFSGKDGAVVAADITRGLILKKQQAEAEKELAKAKGEVASKDAIIIAQDMIRARQMEENRQFLIQNLAMVDAMTIGMNSLSSSIDAVGTAFVESAFKGGEAWDEFGTIMGNVLKQMVAQLIAAMIKIAIFKLLTSFVTPGGVGSFAVQAAAGAFSQQVPTEFKAQGMNSMVRKPTSLMVGESGPEDVIIKPRTKSGSGNSGSTINVNIGGDVFGAEKFTEAVRVAQDKLNRDLV